MIRDDVPKLRIAIGVVSPAESGSLYQQLHSYPVGNSGKELAARTHGAKYWILPVRREVLIGLDGIIGVESEENGLFDRVQRGRGNQRAGVGLLLREQRGSKRRKDGGENDAAHVADRSMTPCARLVNNWLIYGHHHGF